MKLLLGVLFAALLIISCSSTQPVSEHPDVAKIPELQFFYWKNNAWNRVRGQGGDYFNVGDAKKFLVTTNTKGSDCIINYQDGDTQNTYDCSQSNQTEIDLGTYYANNPPIEAISVAMKNLGNQVGYMYSNMDTHRASLPVSFKCPYQETTSNISVCSRPATYPFIMQATVPGAGAVQFVYQCDGEAENVQNFTASNAGTMNFQMSESQANYCDVSLNFAGGGVQQQQIIHVRFYDNQYIPLALPVVTTVQGGYQVCAGEDYDAYTVNGADHGSLGAGSCITVQGATLDFLAWDSIGRMTWAYQTATMTNALVGYRITANGFKFYDDARAWFQKRVTHCGSDLNCVKQEKLIALKDKTLVKAATAWNAKLLYN